MTLDHFNKMIINNLQKFAETGTKYLNFAGFKQPTSWTDLVP
jgi:hypothetical protein